MTTGEGRRTKLKVLGENIPEKTQSRVHGEEVDWNLQPQKVRRERSRTKTSKGTEGDDGHPTVEGLEQKKIGSRERTKDLRSSVDP